MRHIGLLLAVLFSVNVLAEQPNVTAIDNSPRIAIIIDDMGNRLEYGKRAVALPGNVTINILPFTPYAKYFASLATQAEKEVMLHIPMEAISGRNPGKGSLHTHMSQQEFTHVLDSNLAQIPNIKGISNHMGSRLTQNGKMMEWLMSALADHGKLYFVDSRTTSETIAIDYARKNDIAHAKRDVFLDHSQTYERILHQWQRMIRLAHRNGSAIAIGHPHRITVEFLEKHLSDIEAEGFRLVSVSELLQWRQTRRNYAWQTSLSHSHKVVKN